MRALFETHQSNTDPSRCGDPAGPLLHFDILRVVCDSLTEIPDVLSFARTCSALAEDALRRRLRMAPVDLSDADVINSFHSFIFSNEPSRAPCVYGLKVPSPYYGLRGTMESRLRIVDDRLVEILEAARHVQFLHFATSISSPVFDAVVRLTTVRELSVITDVLQGPLRSRLASFRSPLRSLRVSGSQIAGDMISTSFLHDHLGHFAPTLEMLDLDHLQIEVSPASLTTQFTAVRSLKLASSFLLADFDVLGTLLRLFPKLDGTLTLGPLRTNVGEYIFQSVRERSKNVQKVHAWSALDLLICDAETVYLMALQCPIRRMYIDVETSDSAYYLVETLRHQAPQQLYIHLMLFDGSVAPIELFPPEAAANLTHLIVFADLEARHGEWLSQGMDGILVCLHSDQLVDMLINSLKFLHLTRLRIVFHYTVYLFVNKAVLDADRGELRAVDGMDLPLTAGRLFDTMPTLQYLFLTTCGQAYARPTRGGQSGFRTQTLNKWLSSMAWRVFRAEEELHPLDSDVASVGSCVELDREAAERMVHEEELELSLRDKEKVWKCSNSDAN